jgi:putative protease
MVHETHCLNTAIVADIPDVFAGFAIDVSDIKTETNVKKDKLTVIRHFENLLNGNPDAAKAIEQIIYPTTNAQYKTGI